MARRFSDWLKLVERRIARAATKNLKGRRKGVVLCFGRFGLRVLPRALFITYTRSYGEFALRARLSTSRSVSNY